MDAALPASVSRLAQLTYLRLRELHGLRCAPGWARLPALVCLDFHECMFAADSEAALPGMGALAALTSLCIWRYPRMRVLPASLWRLPQLRHLSHQADNGAGTGAPRSELPGAGLPLSAPCFASMLRLSLAGHSLRAFPPGVLAMKCLVLLDLSGTAEPGRVVAAPAWPLPRDKRLRAAAERSLVPQSAPGALRQRLVSASACGRGARRRRIEFETDMFVGCVVIWVAGLPSAPPGLFKGQRRRTSIAVQAPSRAPPAPPLHQIFAEHK